MSVLQSEFDAGYPEIQAPFMWWIGDTYAGNFGPRRSQRLEPLKTFQSGGIRWGSGSDYSVTPLAARYGLWASIAREPLKGVYGPMPFGKEESVDIRTALRSYTIWNARQLFLEDKIGSLEIGKAADIVVWDRDLYGVPSVAIKDLKCMLTIFDGKVVYRAIGFH
jgi:predicted amidohydrolase YtcJ